MRTYDLVIIGAGSAGMASAIEAYDLGVKDILILEKNDCFGGILNQCIHNGFGLTEFKEELTGPEFLTRFADEVKKRNIEVKFNSFVESISKDKEIYFSNEIDGPTYIKAKAIIVATGCYERTSGAIMLPGSRPIGVMSAGQAQLYLNIYGYMPGKRFFILGSGDIGLIMARRLTLEGGEVLGVSEIMPYSNGLNRNIQQCLIDFNIPLYLSHTVTKIIGKSRIEAIELSEVDENRNPIKGSEKIIECDTLILSVGLIPNSFLLINSYADLNKNLGAKVNEFLETSNEGVFTCGNVLHVHDVVDFVVSEARVAARGAVLYLENKLNKNNEIINVKNLKNISYVLPNYINKNPLENVDIKFRVSKPLKNQYIVVKLNDKIIKKIKKIAVIPSEMIQINVDKNLLNEPGNLTIELSDE